jgi:hypothetical protein
MELKMYFIPENETKKACCIKAGPFLEVICTSID